MNLAQASDVARTNPDGPFRLVVADPPWTFSDRLPPSAGAMGTAGRSAMAKYSTMTVEEIKAMKLPLLADSCVLLLWRVSAMVEEAYAVCRAWGFAPKTEMTWIKTRKGALVEEAASLDEQVLAFGMGHYVRAAHETCVVATRGKLAGCRPKVRNERSVFFAPRGEHSAKPDEFFAKVERMYDGPRLELFSRKSRPGWTCVGEDLR